MPYHVLAYLQGTGATTPTPSATTRALWHLDGDAFGVNETGGPSAFSGGATASTSESKFGTGSVFFNNNTREIAAYSPTAYLFEFGTTSFSIDFWVMFPVVPTSYQYFINTDTNTGWTWSPNAGGNLEFSTPSAIVDTTVPWTPTANVWYHLAFERIGGDAYIYVNGQNMGNSASEFALSGGTGINWANGIIKIGGTGGNYFNGYMDEFRIMYGAPTYGGTSFTPPTTRYQIV